ncbi:protein kinase domain-containing protein [Streptomyces sp. 2A115]|uniref:protein kinase domain-containing protein n=1 Tax=Streptomyces sp. 2A115 TaxID=3457439 RepID=UPI003FCF7D10
MSSKAGRLIGGRYRLAERIGSGGMGTVWRAVDELVEREVAVKQPRLPGDPEDAAHQRAANRLYREARAAARVEHPAAVTIHDVVVEDGLPWIVMELVRGRSLHDEVLQRGDLEPVEAARIGLAVVGALDAAHAVGIVHRDVKPANVLLGQHGRVILTDFGIAHIQGEESLTASGEFVGSLEFIAPERMSGRGAGPASDLWSLGVLLYAAVEGWSPFRRTTLESTLAAILSADPPEPKQAGPLGPLIVRLLAKDPAQRPDTKEVTAALEAVAEGWPVPRRDPAVPQDASALREFADDAGTVQLGGSSTPDPDEAPDRSESPTPARVPDTPARTSRDLPEAVPPKRKRSTTRLVAGTLAGAVLIAGGVWLGTSLTDDDGDAAAAGGSPSAPITAGRSSPSPDDGQNSPSPEDSWIAHEETELNAVLSLPGQYERVSEPGGADDDPQTAIYDNEQIIQVRLTQWDEAPRSPMDEAKESADAWAGFGESKSRFTPTSFHGYEAVLVDTTYVNKGTPNRVMELMILTDDNRMYELRVDMPKGTANEKRGTAVFKGARGRLEIGETREWSPSADVSAGR